MIYNLKLILMTTNIFIETLSRLKSSTTVSELAADFKREINYVVFRQLSLRSDQLVKKFNQMEKRYKKAWNRLSNQEWQEDERKLFLWFVLAYCKVFVKKFSEITESEWNQFSACFHHKSLLLLKYEVKIIEKNSQRVHWDPFEEKLLNACIQSDLNGKWAAISKHIFFKSEGNFFKTPKQCREHWFNHMNKKIKKGEWSIHEDLVILDSVQKEGRKWARVVDLLTNQRTEHMIKNRFNSLMTCARRLSENNKNKSQEDIMNYLIDQLRQQSSLGLLNQSKYDENAKKEHNQKMPQQQQNNNQPIQNHLQRNFINQSSLSSKVEQLDEKASKKRSKNQLRFQATDQKQTVVMNPPMNMARQQMFGMMTGVPILYGMPSMIPHSIMMPQYQHFFTMPDYSQPNNYFYKFA